jgi:phosphohistidine phosphatase
MLVYLVRHGIAEDHAATGSDAERKLVAEGKEKTKKMMKSLAKMMYPVPDVVVSSPLVRAEQTAQLALEYFATDAEYKVSDSLTPMSDVLNTIGLIEGLKNDYGVAMLVGHEPHMSMFGSALLGVNHPAIEMKKSAVALFELHRIEPFRVRGTLITLLSPRLTTLS